MSFARRIVPILLLATAARAQSPAEHVAAGDREAEAFHPDAALKHYEAALASDPKNVAALQNASKAAVDIGESTPDKKQAADLFELGEKYAREAVAVAPNDAESALSSRARAGRAALNVGVRDRVKYAVEIREQALDALKIDPEHPGALHVLGMWNAEVMRLNGVERFFAKNVLGGKVFGLANWNDAVSNLEHAVRVDPKRPTHRLDLGMIYRDVGEKAKARQELEAVLSMPQVDVNDGIYKQQAKDALARLK
ncbi:MAG: hypothetical protein U0163_07385 [Gemmatimonadaceae bacterium]